MNPHSLLPDYTIYEPLDYRDGPEGFIKWCEDYVHIPIYPEGSDIPIWVSLGKLPSEVVPETNRSYKYIWDQQKYIIRDCLRMVNGRFIYRLLVFCWMRGEGKSLIAVIIQLWKFFNWPKQQIVFGANSKDQIKFVHYDIARDIILNSPKLSAIVGSKNIQEKAILLRDKKNRIASRMMAISSFSGIVSNITGYTFSEIFDMKNPRFFVQLDGSIRNIPNAFGVIDSTVSTKTHILYSLFTNYTDGKSKNVYFSYRFSLKGFAEDYWNPYMNQAQLDDYKTKFPAIEFDRYFLNVWSSASMRAFSDEMIESIYYLGYDSHLSDGKSLQLLLSEIQEEKDKYNYIMANLLGYGNKGNAMIASKSSTIKTLNSRLYPVSSVYTFKSNYGNAMADLEVLYKLSELYDTDWAITCGIDRSDPMKMERLSSRTIFTCIAKGLPGSRSKPFLTNDEAVPNYIYFMLYMVHVTNNTLEAIKELILTCHSEYDGVDTLCGERWGIWDLENWSLEYDIKFEAVYPTYDKQRGAFNELYLIVQRGLFKSPDIPVVGSRDSNILQEEMTVFQHDVDKKWFGSPEKMEKNGIQDDAMFATAWCIYGGRELTVMDFKARNRKTWFGTYIPPAGVKGNRLTNFA